MASGWTRWGALALAVATFLSAAKTHGRHVRLERELAGHWHVTFGVPNHPWVEALWRRDRLVYWSTAAALALAGVALALLAPRFRWRLPLSVGVTRSWPSVLFLALLGPMTGAFVTAGAVSLVRLRAALSDPAATSAMPAGWAAAASSGTAGWWALTLVCGVALGFALARR
jgi:hypothetical protein